MPAAPMSNLAKLDDLSNQLVNEAASVDLLVSIGTEINALYERWRHLTDDEKFELDKLFFQWQTAHDGLGPHSDDRLKSLTNNIIGHQIRQARPDRH